MLENALDISMDRIFEKKSMSIPFTTLFGTVLERETFSRSTECRSVQWKRLDQRFGAGCGGIVYIFSSQSFILFERFMGNLIQDKTWGLALCKKMSRTETII